MFWRRMDKNILRNILYFISVALIGYFMFSINSTAQDITEKEIAEKKVIEENNPFKFILDSENKTYKTYGEYIWIICLALLQIVFLVMFILMLYQNE